MIANSNIKSSARFRDGCKFLLKCEQDAVETAALMNQGLLLTEQDNTDKLLRKEMMFKN